MSACLRLRAGFACEGARVGVRSDEPGDVAWLEEFLRPWFRATPLRSADPAIEWVHDASEFDRLVRAMARGIVRPTPCFALDREVVTLPGRVTTQGRIVVDAGLRSVYVVRGPSIRVVTTPGETWARLGVVRVVRDLARARLAQASWRALHAAAAVVEGHGVLILGPKRAGKTTLLAYLLAAGTAEYVANDWCWVGRPGSAGGPPRMRGMPTVVRIRPGTARLVSALGEDLGRLRSFLRGPAEPDEDPTRAAAGLPRSRARFVSPAAFAARLGATTRAVAPLRALLFPRRATTGTPLLRRLDPRQTAARLVRAPYGHGAAGRASTIFGGEVPSTPAAELRALAEDLPSFEVSLSPAAFRTAQAARALARAVGRAAGSTDG